MTTTAAPVSHSDAFFIDGSWVAPSSGATIVFKPTAGVAEGQQIAGKAQGAEVIGAALVYPNHEPGAQLTVIENCLGQGVKEPKE